jgi:hypothetical protein
MGVGGGRIHNLDNKITEMTQFKHQEKMEKYEPGAGGSRL